MSEVADSGLWGLFASAFVSATLFPGGSEVVFVWMLRDAAHAPTTLLAVAALGNSLGGMSSWLVGRLLPRDRLLGSESRRRAAERVARHGAPVLLLAWLPVIGDPLCAAAGWLRVNWLASLAFITLGKTARYAALLTLG